MGTLLWSGRCPVRRKRELVVAFQLARSVGSCSEISDSHVTIKGEQFARDEMTNITPRILSHLDRNLHLQPQHPLCLIKQRIVNYMYNKYRGNRGMPTFSVHEQISPVVSLEQNFDSLLVAADHVSRQPSDSYYLNRNKMLRAHTSAHQTDLIRMGLDNFLVVGDVYRRDEVDRTHYPVFHQVEGVRLLGGREISKMSSHMEHDIQLFEPGERSAGRQGVHTRDAAQLVEADLKSCLAGLARHLFGDQVEFIALFSVVLNGTDCVYSTGGMALGRLLLPVHPP